MDSEKQNEPSTSKQISKTTKELKKLSISSNKSQTKEVQKKIPHVKLKKSREKYNKKPRAIVPDPSFHNAVENLHVATKKVKGKLMVKNEYFTPKLPFNPNAEEIEESEILKEIKRLQDLLEKMRIKKNKKNNENGEIGTSFQDNPESVDTTENIENSNLCKEAVPLDENKTEKRKRVRPKKRKKKLYDELLLQKSYEDHINQIIHKNSTDKDNTSDLKFQYGDDLEAFAAKCVEAGLGRIIEGEVRINAKNNHQAFITQEDGNDAIITSMAARRFALEGDIVRAFVKISTNAKDTVEQDTLIDTLNNLEVNLNDSDVVATEVEILKATEPITSLSNQAFVINISKEIGNRQFVGAISFKNPSKHDDGEYFKLRPRDPKAPIMCIPVESCEEEIAKQGQSDDITGFLYVAEVLEIEDTGRCIGKLIAPVGKCGNLNAEIKAILMHNKLKDVVPFEQRFDDMWKDPVNITDADIKQREDLRADCIFTIDPLTARDLDDAMSCRKLNNGCYEIGVHISDVTHYLEEASELDELVKLRATSIYLVNEVIHMLPQTLCMKCSLLPNEDKFTFSIFWVIDENAKVLSTRCSRSIIRSCTQFAYEHAQKIIDNPNEKFTANDFPAICNGFTVSDIVERVKTLNSLAEIMRKRRFENGSLSIDKPQFYFQLDLKTGEPIAYDIASRYTANFLIEEFMLLANQTVAQMIYNKFPDISFLRSHQPPKPSAIKSLKAKLTAVGIDLDMTSSKTIYDGLQRICGSSSSPEFASAAMNYLLTKPMMRAKYFCSENVDTEAGLHHYALALPIYTHFTSPIRRYPDIIVHRLLAAALKYSQPPQRSPEELHILAKICNDQKQNAKSAGEECANLFFKRYIKAKKSVNYRAVVVDIYRHSIEVIIIETGHLITVPFKIQKVEIDASKAPALIKISEKNSKLPPIEIKMFSPIDIKLMLWEERLSGFFVTPDKKQRKLNEITTCERRAQSEMADRLDSDNQEIIQKRKKKPKSKKRTKKSEEKNNEKALTSDKVRKESEAKSEESIGNPDMKKNKTIDQSENLENKSNLTETGKLKRNKKNPKEKSETSEESTEISAVQATSKPLDESPLIKESKETTIKTHEERKELEEKENKETTLKTEEETKELEEKSNNLEGVPNQLEKESNTSGELTIKSDDEYLTPDDDFNNSMEHTNESDQKTSIPLYEK